MNSVTALEAKTRFGELLDRVARAGVDATTPVLDRNPMTTRGWRCVFATRSGLPVVIRSPSGESMAGVLVRRKSPIPRQPRS